ncbi:hypothetical protein [Chlamydia buteonis]|uniref:Uncharacterized protein n=1 Tax=Chlamydia buteonis TaxID=2494525 RepID=A0ABX8L9L4_9CHLA|nr:hypothetical protein [Chlamydia buteonis]QXE27038.1 hypothetical protein HBN95_02690 [Chlamydia buteonis]QXE28022.1 hypothetical protein JJJ19_00455 [Chlamydia buteonis]
MSLQSVSINSLSTVVQASEQVRPESGYSVQGIVKVLKVSAICETIIILLGICALIGMITYSVSIHFIVVISVMLAMLLIFTMPLTLVLIGKIGAFAKPRVADKMRHPAVVNKESIPLDHGPVVNKEERLLELSAKCEDYEKKINRLGALFLQQIKALGHMKLDCVILDSLEKAIHYSCPYEASEKSYSLFVFQQSVLIEEGNIASKTLYQISSIRVLRELRLIILGVLSEKEIVGLFLLFANNPSTTYFDIILAEPKIIAVEALLRYWLGRVFPYTLRFFSLVDFQYKLKTVFSSSSWIECQGSRFLNQFTGLIPAVAALWQRKELKMGRFCNNSSLSWGDWIQLSIKFSRQALHYQGCLGSLSVFQEWQENGCGFDNLPYQEVNFVVEESLGSGVVAYEGPKFKERALEGGLRSIKAFRSWVQGTGDFNEVAGEVANICAIRKQDKKHADLQKKEDIRETWKLELSVNQELLDKILIGLRYLLSMRFIGESRDVRSMIREELEVLDIPDLTLDQIADG